MNNHPVRVYITGRFDGRGRLRDVAVKLATLGVDVISTWIQVPDEVKDVNVPRSVKIRAARNNLSEIDFAEVVVVDFTGGPSSTGGYHFEAGYAFAKRKPLLIIGDTDGIFYAGERIYRAKDWNDAFCKLAALRNGPHGVALAPADDRC